MASGKARWALIKHRQAQIGAFFVARSCSLVPIGELGRGHDAEAPGLVGHSFLGLDAGYSCA